jgi:MarR family transcriptional regulator, organic hydroperoxide resistance regulator
VYSSTEMAAVLLEIVPKLLWRIRPNLPLDADSSDAGPGWREVAELRATPGQMTLLRILVEQERCTMQGLAERLAVTPSTVTAMVKRLLAQGYIERSRGDTDWRTVWVTPTSSGRLAVSVYRQARLSTLKRFLEQLSDEERATIQAALPALLHLVEVQA